jgi:ABC-2 type transport system ATP-binding protein
MLEAIGLTKHYGANTALDSLNLRVEPGDIYCLLGANGAGKTTTINLFLNFLQPSDGVALINGVDVTHEPLRTKQELAYIPEQVNLYPTLSGIENLRYFSALALGHELPRERLIALMEDVDLDPSVADRRVGGYSKGMRQKIWIAVALAKQARALLLDEPTSGLDPHAANEFSNLLTRASASGVAILTTTHDLFHARHTGTRIGIMKRGKLVENLESKAITDVELQTLYLRHMGTSA